MKNVIVMAGFSAVWYALVLSESGHWAASVCPMVCGLIAVWIGLVNRG